MKKRHENGSENTKHNEEPAEPSYEAVAARAHEILIQEDCCHGKHEEQWLKAEKELRNAR